MAADEFAKTLPLILGYEGGKVDDPRDPGGRTNKGITQSTYDAYLQGGKRQEQSVFLITDVEVTAIYRQLYWNKIAGDSLPLGLGLAVFDAAVNSGVFRASVWLQEALIPAYKGNIDGQIGPETLQAIQTHGDTPTLIAAFCGRRLDLLKRLPTWPTFGKGWSARVANVWATAVAWTKGTTA
jgi:lysozyme family protein